MVNLLGNSSLDKIKQDEIEPDFVSALKLM